MNLQRLPSTIKLCLSVIEITLDFTGTREHECEQHLNLVGRSRSDAVLITSGLQAGQPRFPYSRKQTPLEVAVARLTCPEKLIQF